MSSRRILLIQGHPDPATSHLCHALAASYATGAHDAGHVVRWVNVAALDFPLLRNQQEWEQGALPPTLRSAGWTSSGGWGGAPSEVHGARGPATLLDPRQRSTQGKN